MKKIRSRLKIFLKERNKMSEQERFQALRRFFQACTDAKVPRVNYYSPEGFMPNSWAVNKFYLLTDRPDYTDYWFYYSPTTNKFYAIKTETGIHQLLREWDPKAMFLVIPGAGYVTFSLPGKQDQ